MVEKIKKNNFDKALWSAFLFFFGATILAWVFSEKIATVFLYKPGYEVIDIFLFERAKIIIITTISIIIGLITYISLEKYKNPKTSLVDEKSVQKISQEIISDLMLSREQFKKLYESSPVPYFLMDDEGNIRNPNRATLRFFRGTSEECTSSNFYALLSETEDSEKTNPLLRAKVERAVPVSQEEMSLYTLDQKTIRFALVSIYSLERTSPIPFRHLVTLVDVSKERESERMKTDFLLLASHQLRTPLTTIKWYIDYLLSSDSISLSSIVREYLEQIYIGNERMIELITTLLTVSRIEMGTLAPDYTVIHINEIIKDVIEELSTDIKKRSTQVKIVSEGYDALTMDRTMMRIIIHNLLTNAVKYTPIGGTVTVNSQFSTHSCTISVSDSGYGIPEEEQDKIFSKMFRASNARKVSANGTGLGLYMSKAFTEKLGGILSFKSEEGKGSTFFITLPRVAPDA